MHCFRNGLAPTRRMLAHRLDQLCSTLDSLGSQLRSAVSNAVGETVGVVVRDALNNALDQIGYRPDRAPPRARSRAWQEDDDEDRWPHDGWEDDEPEQYPRTSPDENRPHKLALSVSAGLSASAWWLKRWTGQLGAVSAAIVGVVTGCTAYSVPAFAAAGMRFIGSVGQFALLSDAVQSLSSS